MTETTTDPANPAQPISEPQPRLNLTSPLRGLVARDAAKNGRAPGFDYPRLTGRL